MSKKTVILGATTNPNRYAHLAAHKLKGHGHEIVPIGLKKGHTADEPILDLKENPLLKK